MSEKQDTPHAYVPEDAKPAHAPPWFPLHPFGGRAIYPDGESWEEIAEFKDADDCAHALHCVNTYPDLLRALEAALPSVRREANASWRSANTTSVSERFRWTQEAERLDKIAEEGRAALAKAKGGGE